MEVQFAPSHSNMARAAEESEGWPSEDKRAVEWGVDPDPPLNQVESVGHGQDGGDEAVKMADAPPSEPAIPSEIVIFLFEQGCLATLSIKCKTSYVFLLGSLINPNLSDLG